MNTTWLTLSKERRIEILNQATELTGLPALAIDEYENDYSEMAKFMIYGEALTFDRLVKRISELQITINEISQP